MIYTHKVVISIKMSLLSLKEKFIQFIDEITGKEQVFFDQSNTIPSSHIHLQTTPGMPEEKEEGQLSLDVYQTSDEIIIKAPVAGVNLNEINITVADGILTIRGERKQEEFVPLNNYYLQECYWGSFSRSIVLPNQLRTEQIKAMFKNGVLKITIPKDENLKIKNIPINI